MRRREIQMRAWLFDQRLKAAGFLWISSQALNEIAEKLRPDLGALSERDREALSWRNLETEEEKVVSAKEWREKKQNMLAELEAAQRAQEAQNGYADPEDDGDEEGVREDLNEQAELRGTGSRAA